MFIAIRSGQGSSVDAVLNAGADINLVVTSKRMKETLTPLEYAIRIKHLESVSRLLSRGATIPPVSKWPLSHLRIYSRIRDEKFRREGIRVIDYYGFRNLSTEARAAL
jgi:ankyrin repeat protein